MPWRTDKKDLLPTNYYRANERFRRLINRLLKEPELFRANHEQIMGYLQSGFISKVEAPDQPTTRSEFYLLHRPVIRSQAVTTKIRPVFDASARTDEGLSLNDCLETGENLNPELLAVLLRFRWHRVAWVGNIEKAFLQIEIHAEDRDALRFLWIDDLTSSTLEKEPSIFCWNRVTFGLSPSRVPYYCASLYESILRALKRWILP
uniref:Reverse transcriptase domain-containing protein n=1 Tax=Daphnia galeata TaxID=27404 RepID=A0A8J2RNM5_9CRUS|nr:unnamed protein product [Daphnia galeata]